MAAMHKMTQPTKPELKMDKDAGNRLCSLLAETQIGRKVDLQRLLQQELDVRDKACNYVLSR